jgi:hypothetical protein
MAVNEIGNVSEIENWQSTEQSSFPARMWSGLTKFARKKPLGFVCGVIVIIFFIIGDAIPATANKIADTTGLGDEPVPYIADQLDHELGFI